MPTTATSNNSNATPHLSSCAPLPNLSPIFLDSPHKHTTHNTTMTKAPTGNEAAKHRNERTYRSPPVSFPPAIGRVLVQLVQFHVHGMCGSARGCLALRPVRLGFGVPSPTTNKQGGFKTFVPKFRALNLRERGVLCCSWFACSFSLYSCILNLLCCMLQYAACIVPDIRHAHIT